MDTPKLVFRSFCCIFLFVAGLAAQQIQYNSLYNCPDSSLYDFKVLNCSGSDCEVFFKNNSPEGGWKGELSKSKITAAIRTGKCTIDGNAIPAGTPTTPAVTTGPTRPVATGNDGGDELAEGKECVASVPAAAANSRRPSPALIKRVIYERYRDMESGRPVGITFKSLALSTSFVNRLVDGGLLHQSAPVGATIYRYKTSFFTCVKYTDSIIRTGDK